MSRFVAVLTSEPFLVRCELARVRHEVALDSAELSVGVGAFEEHTPLLNRYGPGAPHGDVWETPESDAVIIHAQALPVGQSLEDNIQPFRFRQWFFAHGGHVERPEKVRQALLEMVPDFLHRAIKGGSVSEVMFAVFLGRLRSIGRMEDPGLEASVAANLLAQTARSIEQVTAEVGGPAKSQLSLVATNGRLLVASRAGPTPLYYRLLEGEGSCGRCGLAPGGKDSEPLVRDHRRRRSVAIATDPAHASSWLSIADGGALAVDRKLAVHVLAPTDVR